MFRCRHQQSCRLLQSEFEWIFPAKQVQGQSRCKLYRRTDLMKVRLRSTYVYLSRGNLTTCTVRHESRDWLLTNLELLLFRMVFAFPYASSTGFAWMIFSSNEPTFNEMYDEWRMPLSPHVIYLIMQESQLYLPRAYWHKVECLDNCIYEVYMLYNTRRTDHHA